MRRELLSTNAFVRAARRLVKKDARLAGEIRLTPDLLSSNAFQASLKTHKPKGELEGSWACSAGYDLRIVFKLVAHEGTEAILLETVGTHQEVY